MSILKHTVIVVVIFALLHSNSPGSDPAATPIAKLPDTSDASRGLDLSKHQLATLYEADFSKPLNYVKEAELFDGDKRSPVPAGVDWVLEGEADARIDQGQLVLTNKASHLVFWQTREFPGDLLIEFAMSPVNPNQGLAIVFFAARGREGGGIFDAVQPRRDGVFKNYHSRDLDCYHTSYWATDANSEARGTAHIRKNHGFHLVAAGRDYIAGYGAGPNRVRVLKLGGEITVEVNGKIAVHWVDDGQTFGPVLTSGLVGLRQMSHTKECRYMSLKVSSVK